MKEKTPPKDNKLGEKKENHKKKREREKMEEFNASRKLKMKKKK